MKRSETKNPDLEEDRDFEVVLPGIEPGTQGFSVLCSTNWAIAPLVCYSVVTGGKCKTFYIRAKQKITFYL